MSTLIPDLNIMNPTTEDYIAMFFEEYIGRIMKDHDSGIKIKQDKKSIKNYLTLQFRQVYDELQTLDLIEFDMNNPLFARAIQNDDRYKSITGRSKQREKIRRSMRIKNNLMKKNEN